MGRLHFLALLLQLGLVLCLNISMNFTANFSVDFLAQPPYLLLVLGVHRVLPLLQLRLGFLPQLDQSVLQLRIHRCLKLSLVAAQLLAVVRGGVRGQLIVHCALGGSFCVGAPHSRLQMCLTCLCRLLSQMTPGLVPSIASLTDLMGISTRLSSGKSSRWRLQLCKDV